MTETLPTDARGVPLQACYDVPETLEDDLTVVERHQRWRLAFQHGAINERMMRLAMLASANRGEVYETTAMHGVLGDRHFFTLNHDILAKHVATQVAFVLYGERRHDRGIAPIHVSFGEGPMVTAHDDVLCYVRLPVYYTLPGSVVRAEAGTYCLTVPLDKHAYPGQWRISEEHLRVQINEILADESVHPITDALYRQDAPLRYRLDPTVVPSFDANFWYWEVLRACGLENYGMIELMTPEDQRAIRRSRYTCESTGNADETFALLFGRTPWTREQTEDMHRAALADGHLRLQGQEAKDYARHAVEDVRADVAGCGDVWVTADWLERNSGGLLTRNDCDALVTQGMTMETNILRNAEKMMRRGGRGDTAYVALKKALDDAAR